MPYGVDKDQGGDSPSNVKWMEKCVSGITGTNKRTGKPYTKGEKIAICKTALKNKKSELEDEIIIPDSIYDSVSSAIADSINKLMTSGRVNTFEDALMLTEAMLAKSNYNIDTLRFILFK